MLRSVACDAIAKGKRLELRYDGFLRVVEVHTVGRIENSEKMRAFQVRGGSKSGDSDGWKLFDLNKAFAARVIDEKSDAPRRGYKRRDAAFEVIFCEVDPSTIAGPRR